MKIGYLSADFGVDAFGHAGNSIHVRELVEALRRAGHSVHLISPVADPEGAPPGHRFRPGDPPIRVESLPLAARHVELLGELEELDRFLGRGTRVRQELRNLLYNTTLYEAGLRQLRRVGVDCVYERYAFGSYAGVRIARELGVPHLLEVNAPLRREQEERAGLEMRQLADDLERRILCASDHVFAVSEGLRRFALECAVSPERISVLPNAVDPERFAVAPGERAALRRRLGVGECCVIGFVGSLKRWHGTELLIEAIALLRTEAPDLRLLIVGEGPDGARLQALAEERGVTAQVTFAGLVPYPDVPAHLAAMDIAVAPGTRRDDFYFSPLKLYEYMASGRAVVAGAIGQQAEIIADGETGRLFEPGDSSALAKVLGELARAPALREELGKRAREAVLREHTWDHNAAALLAVARRLAG